MNWLVIDTCTSVLGVAVMSADTLLGERTTAQRRHHTERLLPAIDRLLQETERTMSQIDGIAVTRGPGSYTGVRIGVTTAKTLAWSLDVPLIGISSLAALAANGRSFNGYVVPMWDARRERVYTGCYQFAYTAMSEGQQMHLSPTCHLAERVTPLDAWIDELARRTDGPCLFLGDGAKAYRASIAAQLGERAFFASALDDTVRPAAVGLLAIEKWRVNGSDDVHRFAPNYLQATEAERNWNRQNRASKN
ncbi:tRNA (adenosine(37)-N6)-threonylcarbamoyltransferase complex dimerization subunit type 1 TsaB [Numidum massiliense]|uniref:tRNA (adenosine(37)-N6)-threonylcarbamoyltransferase complex dimerization subunit type 1 TsaB n=1 Tax=Numidum massiliense TaxID=1522315 RepID=UPI0006D53C3F|nr:tRNA (adenosine(37)-N6)-threonylcarbamoyltransferase complex dimerization subunit type 1 TsaB [Numidum massiliense]